MDQNTLNSLTAFKKRLKYEIPVQTAALLILSYFIIGSNLAILAKILTCIVFISSIWTNITRLFLVQALVETGQAIVSSLMNSIQNLAEKKILDNELKNIPGATNVKLEENKLMFDTEATFGNVIGEYRDIQFHDFIIIGDTRYTYEGIFSDDTQVSSLKEDEIVINGLFIYKKVVN